MKEKIWILRLLIVLYLIYKLIVSFSIQSILQIEGISEKTDGRFAAHIFWILIIVPLLIFILWSFGSYQIKQAISEYKGVNIEEKRKHRLTSIIFSIIFFSLTFKSLFNTGEQEVKILLEVNSWFNIYQIFTLIASTSAFIILWRDFKLRKISRRDNV